MAYDKKKKEIPKEVYGEQEALIDVYIEQETPKRFEINK